LCYRVYTGLDIHGTIFYRQQTIESIIDHWHLFYPGHRLFHKMVCIGSQRSRAGQFQEHDEDELAGGYLYKYFIFDLINMEVV
jgi:hypothetical protein